MPNCGRGWPVILSPGEAPEVSSNADESITLPYYSIDDRWQGVRNALAGLFCASLGSLDEQRTTSPRSTFPPEGALPDWGLPHELRHASHASEHVCTENLTPFLKLLPCKSRSGLAMLLNPHRIFDADWHGIGLHVLWRPEGVEVRLSVQLVSDPLRISGQKKQGASKAHTVILWFLILLCQTGLLVLYLTARLRRRVLSPSTVVSPWNSQVLASIESILNLRKSKTE